MTLRFGSYDIIIHVRRTFWRILAFRCFLFSRSHYLIGLACLEVSGDGYYLKQNVTFIRDNTVDIVKPFTS
jgi:hypothetical protein